MKRARGRGHEVASESDDDLLVRARAGDSAAYGELWRRHAGAGMAIARRLGPPDLADDLVAEAFVRILSTIQRGNGPLSGFRPYLITTIRNVSRRWAEKPQAVQVDDFDQYEDPDTLDDPAIAALDRTLTLTAFRSLPERWQTVLWYSEVEGMDPHEIAPFLGMTPNATAALSYRARAGLREAWLRTHVKDDASSPECRWTTTRLSGYVADKLSQRERQAVAEHLRSCTKCTIIAGELDHIGSRLAFVLLPVLLGTGVGAAVLRTGMHAISTAAAAPAPPMPPAVHPVSLSSPAPRPGNTVSAGWITAGAITLTLAAAGVAALAVGLGQAPAGNDLAGSAAATTTQEPAPLPTPRVTPTPIPAPPPAPPAPPPVVDPPAGVPAAPAAVIPQTAPVVVSSPSSGLLTNHPAPVVSGTGTIGATVLISEGAYQVTTTVDPAGNWSIAVPLADGMHTLTITQHHGTDLPSSPVAISITVDTLAPAAPIVTTPVDDHALQPFTVAGTAEPGATVTVYDDDAVLLSTVVADAFGAWDSGQLVGLLPTVTSLTVLQADGAGNISPATPVGPIAIVPTIADPADGTVFALLDPIPITVEGWAGTDVQLRLDGVLLLPQATLDASGTLSLSIIGLPPGPHSVAVNYIANGQPSPSQAQANFTVSP